MCLTPLPSSGTNLVFVSCPNPGCFQLCDFAYSSPSALNTLLSSASLHPLFTWKVLLITQGSV